MKHIMFRCLPRILMGIGVGGFGIACIITVVFGHNVASSVKFLASAIFFSGVMLAGLCLAKIVED